MICENTKPNKAFLRCYGYLYLVESQISCNKLDDLENYINERQRRATTRQQLRREKSPVYDDPGDPKSSE